jgi:hypothetical protein
MYAQKFANCQRSFSTGASIGEVEHHYSDICIYFVLQGHQNNYESTTDTKTERSKNRHRELSSHSLLLKPKPNLNYTLGSNSRFKSGIETQHWQVIYQTLVKLGSHSTILAKISRSPTPHNQKKKPRKRQVDTKV